MKETKHFKYEQASCRLVVWGDGRATLSNVYSIKRNRGHGKALLEMVCNYADENGLIVVLEARPYGGDHLCPGPAALRAFYSRFGFVHTDGDFMERAVSQELHAP